MGIWDLSIPSFRGFSLFRTGIRRWREVRRSGKLSIPSFRGFSLFLFDGSFTTSSSTFLSIPSFRGFSLFHLGLKLSLQLCLKEIFQSPVLGAFLCFGGLEGLKEWATENLSIPSFRGFSLFLTAVISVLYMLRLLFQSPVLGAFLCFQYF